MESNPRVSVWFGSPDEYNSTFGGEDGWVGGTPGVEESGADEDHVSEAEVERERRFVETRRRVFSEMGILRGTLPPPPFWQQVVMVIIMVALTPLSLLLTVVGVAIGLVIGALGEQLQSFASGLKWLKNRAIGGQAAGNLHNDALVEA